MILGAVLLGMFLGVAARLFDTYNEFLGTLFSHIAVWILLAVVLAFRSPSPKWAAVRVGAFLVSMVVAYYGAAECMGGVWSEQFLIGWGAIALLSPVPGYLVWYARGRGALSRLLQIGVVAFQAAATWVLFDRLGFSDIVVIVLTAVILLRSGRSLDNHEKRR